MDVDLYCPEFLGELKNMHEDLCGEHHTETQIIMLP